LLSGIKATVFMNRYIIISFLFSLCLPATAQKDTLWKKNLKEITITADRVELYTLGNRIDKPDSFLQRLFKSSPISSLLDASSGLVIRSYGPGILATSSLRGGNAQQTAMTWNGLSINSPVNGLSDLNLVPSFLFDEVSALPGLAGSLQGSGAIGGGINLNNYALKKEGFSAELMQTFGSFGTYSGGLKLNYSKNKWSHTLKGFYSKTNNNYSFMNRAEAGNPKENLTNAEGENYSFLHQTSYQSQKAGNFKINYWGTFANRQIPPTLLMESSTANQLDNIQKTMLQWDKSLKKISLKFHSLFQNDYLRYTEKELDINSISKSIFITNDAELRFKSFKNSTSSIGVVHSFTKAKVANVLSTETTTLNKSERYQLAFWASHFHHFVKLKTSISASLRQELVDTKFLPLIPALGFKTHLHKNLDIYGQTSKVYRIPTLNDLNWIPGGNPELKPETGWANELSAEFNKINKRISFTTSITGYSRLITNWIQWQPVSSPIWSPVNIGKVNSHGLELRSTLQISITNKIYSKTGFNFDYTKSENIDTKHPNYRKQLLYIPYYKSSGFIAFGVKNTVLLIQGVWVGKRYTGSDNLDSIPHYGLLNLAFNHNFTLKKTNNNAFLRINNILNKSYEAIVWRPMPGINFEFGINASLNR
jgi:vitamin B12 transporter